MGARRIRASHALRRLRILNSQAVSPPRSTAWLRRYAAGGWSLEVHHEGSVHHHLVGSIVEAAELISDIEEIAQLHLWSGSRDAYIELDLVSLAPLLEVSHARHPV